MDHQTESARTVELLVTGKRVVVVFTLVVFALYYLNLRWYNLISVMQGLNFDKNKIKQNQKDPTVLPPEFKWQNKMATIYWPHIYSGSEVTGSGTGYLIHPLKERITEYETI